jgi:hypothetical protein
VNSALNSSIESKKRFENIEAGGRSRLADGAKPARADFRSGRPGELWLGPADWLTGI